MNEKLLVDELPTCMNRRHSTTPMRQLVRLLCCLTPEVQSFEGSYFENFFVGPPSFSHSACRMHRVLGKHHV
ncbi:hypothetical protein RSSM_02167 [Rhodopirellula sallentina SM41]|uniref:Uncharacterized protein n=1 Tax=Rhodopirellula sallentina SM41 TaxID=1263870 RepID=M5U4I9_9BACT|nr:hypothetical protein RSSM_02167 [Rhodopirellula sallentina SM41]